MTSHAEQGPFGQEDDQLAGGPILAVFVGALALSVVLVILSLRVLNATEARLRPSRKFPERTERGPRQTVDDPSSALTDRKRKILESYGWIDKSRGIVRIPIARAMELVIERGQ